MQLDLFPVNLHRAGDAGAVAVAEDGHGKLRAPRAHQTGEAHDLALAHMEGDVVDDLLVRVDRVVHVPVLHLQGHVPDLYAAALGKAVRQLAAHHAADDAVLADIIHALGQGLDGLAVAENGDVVRHIADLVDLVGDDDGGHALFLELQQQVQQRLGVLLVQGGGGLVQDHQAGVLGQRLGDLGHLLLAHADVLDQRFGRLGQTHHLQILRGLGVGLVPVDGKLFAPLIAQEHVLPDGHIGDQRQLLVDDDDAFFFTVLDFGEAAHFSLVYDIAAVRAVGIQSAEHVHQRGFSGAVFTDQRVNAALFDHKIHVVQGLYAGKLLGDPPHFQHVFRQVIPSIHESS